MLAQRAKGRVAKQRKKVERRSEELALRPRSTRQSAPATRSQFFLLLSLLSLLSLDKGALCLALRTLLRFAPCIFLVTARAALPNGHLHLTSRANGPAPGRQYRSTQLGSLQQADQERRPLRHKPEDQVLVNGVPAFANRTHAV